MRAKAIEMFAQVNVEGVLGIVEKHEPLPSLACHSLPSCQEIDIFSRGGAERTAAQFNIPFLGSIELIPAIREGGDRGLPVTLAGPKRESCVRNAAEFYTAAQKLMERAEVVAATTKDVLEIS